MVIARSSLSSDVRQPRLVVIYRRFGTTYRSHLQRILEDEIRRLHRNVGNLTINLRCITSQKREYILYTPTDA